MRNLDMESKDRLREINQKDDRIVYSRVTKLGDLSSTCVAESTAVQ